MALVEWKDAYELGIPDVDHEHRALMALINELHENLYRPDAGETVLDFLGELLVQIGSHFALEEQIMARRAYPARDEHKADHERLLDDIRELMDGYEDGRFPDLDDFSRRLEAWFSGHFATHDAKLHRMFD